MTALSHADDAASFRREVLEADIPVVVDFWAAWCGPCLTLGQELEALAEELEGVVKVVKVDVDANPGIARRYDIRGIPTVVRFDRGELVAESVGAKPRAQIAFELSLPSPP